MHRNQKLSFANLLMTLKWIGQNRISVIHGDELVGLKIKLGLKIKRIKSIELIEDQ